MSPIIFKLAPEKLKSLDKKYETPVKSKPAAKPRSVSNKPAEIQDTTAVFGKPPRASIRALDRSGKSVRAWTPQDISIKSFTGYTFTTKCWIGENESELEPEQKYKSPSTIAERDSPTPTDSEQPAAEIQTAMEHPEAIKKIKLSGKKKSKSSLSSMTLPPDETIADEPPASAEEPTATKPKVKLKISFTHKKDENLASADSSTDS
ncbi:hypothetical protein CANCADRAFT_2948 [Tortispora caseinolytica NRRL Y-17796]|uniref:Uncharacterized protein n=1 Tax=Tortispora caseinolytica NRRL Y-17796 TaxID=767744 RepID=A0A1E4THJ4_9ASCO|nr:hypothetical protein CANCADRAFT_2948 [Tortispora caseinolytica NRRL Y-17796]